MMTVLKMTIFIAMLTASIPSYAQSVMDQIEAVDKAHQQHIKIERQEQKAIKAQADAKKKKIEDRLRHKEIREEKHEDTLRELHVEDLKLSLKKKRSRVNREDEFINRELEKMDAKTDVIKSVGEGSRNISTGIKDMMQGIGEGKRNK